LISFTGLVRFAKTGSGTEGLRFRKILNDMSNVGFVKIIVTLIVIYIIAFALSIVIGIIGLIPYIGVFIGIFIGTPFILLFLYRAVGLLYADA
jgi:ABC-type long-subunit fatty acid transport system fused permease/ATPase subunit